MRYHKQWVYKSWALSCQGDQIFKEVPTIFNIIVSFFLTHKNVYIISHKLSHPSGTQTSGVAPRSLETFWTLT
jgi:hypothetical protein